VVRGSEFGQAGQQEPLGEAGEEQRAGQAVGGDLVAAAVRDAFDDLVGAEPAQVVADLPAGGPFFGAGLCAGRVGVALEGAAGSAGRTESASG
jgi:phosphoglucomutase